jgi:hypothetical protein
LEPIASTARTPKSVAAPDEPPTAKAKTGKRKRPTPTPSAPAPDEELEEVKEEKREEAALERSRGTGKVSIEENLDTPLRHKPVVEDPTTGRFRHVTTTAAATTPSKKRPTTAAGTPSGATAATPAARPATEAEKYRLFLRSLEDLAAATFTFCAGLLGGLSLLLFVVAYARTSTGRDFLRMYSPIASACQHTYFVLTSAALVGVFAKASRDRRLGWRGRDLTLPALDALAALLYVIAFALTLANTPVDDVLHYAEARIPGWYDNPLLLDGSYDSTLRRWHGLNTLRMLCCLVAWLLVSIVDPLLTSKHPPASAIYPDR